MRTSRIYIGLVVAVTAFGFEGCSSSSSNNASKSGRSPTGECSSSSNDGNGSTCAEQDTYEACIQNACGAQYKSCFGSEYLSGTYSGICKNEMECLFGCPCTDTACAAACYSNTSTACTDCFNAVDSCEQQSGCVVPVCGANGTGGTSAIGGTTGRGGANSTFTSVGGASSIGSGTTAASVCPYTTASFDCTQACANLKTIATKCQTDPSLSTDIQAVLQLANSGNGTACKAGCAASSPSAPAQWKCYQAVPTAADCTAIAGCSYSNCPP